MNEDQIKELATQAGFTVTQNMKGPVDVIQGRSVEARSEWVSRMTLERLTEQRKYHTHFAFYMMTAGVDYTFVRHAVFTPKPDELTHQEELLLAISYLNEKLIRETDPDRQATIRSQIEKLEVVLETIRNDT